MNQTVFCVALSILLTVFFFVLFFCFFLFWYLFRLLAIVLCSLPRVSEEVFQVKFSICRNFVYQFVNKCF